MTANPADIFLWRALAIFLLIGALSGVALALLLIFKPQLLGRVNRVANRWISTRHIGQVLDRSISIEHWFYQHHRVMGMAVVLGAIYMLVYFGLLFDKPTMLQHLSSRIPPGLLDGLLDALVLSALTGAAVALLAGLFLWLRPSLLRGIEEDANQWVSTRRATQMLDVPHDQVDRFVERHAQRAGWLLLLGSIYLFFALFRLLV
ncbi:MAG: hypothetical protein A2V79_04070 [Betaproteobacteria bacterium RBG_16_56_24]|nr:MAG: hypothetical protein A2V79_04070 [Betaproteobacteria bacterium RBG_16_56_24]